MSALTAGGVQMPERRVHGIRLYYEEHGSGAPIFCIHGTSSSALVWGDAVKELARLGRVIAYDRRGCTRSERPEPYERTSVAEQADDAAALLDALAGRAGGGDRPQLRGRGGNRPRAPLSGSGAGAGLAGTGCARALARVYRVGSCAGCPHSRSGSARVDAVAQALISEVLGEGAWRSFSDELRRMFTHNGPAILAEVEGGELQTDAPALATMDQPVLLVAATDSPPEFREVSVAMADAFPNARTALVGGGHLIDPAAPDVVAFIQEALERH